MPQFRPSSAAGQQTPSRASSAPLLDRAADRVSPNEAAGGDGAAGAAPAPAPATAQALDVFVVSPPGPPVRLDTAAVALPTGPRGPSQAVPWRAAFASPLSGGGELRHAANWRPFVAQPFGVRHMLGGAEVVTVWRPPLQLGAEAPEGHTRLAMWVDRTISPQLRSEEPPPPAVAAQERQLRRTQGQDWTHMPLLLWEADEVAAGEQLAGDWAPAGLADPFHAAAAVSLQLYVTEQQRLLGARAAAQVHTLAALQALVADIRARPAAGEATSASAPLQAEDMDGFDARATYRLPAMLIARRLVVMWRGGTSGLELLDDAGCSLATVAVALSQALEKSPTPPDMQSVARLAAQTEACIDGGPLGADTPASQLAVALLLVAHQMPIDLLSELLKQAVLGPDASS